MSIEQQAYRLFKNDFKGRLRFASKLIDWQILEAQISRKSTEKMDGNFKAKLADGQIARDHFTASKSEMGRLIEQTYFPVIDTDD